MGRCEGAMASGWRSRSVLAQMDSEQLVSSSLKPVTLRDLSHAY